MSGDLYMSASVMVTDHPLAFLLMVIVMMGIPISLLTSFPVRLLAWR